MDVDSYRLAYNIFHRNWQRFGIPEKDIPFPKTEEVEPLNLIIPGFSKAVAFFQITSRSDLKSFFDDCPRVYNFNDFNSRFEKMMKEVFPERFIIRDLPKDTVKEDLPKDTVKELPRDTRKEDLPKDTMKEGLPKDTMKEGLPKDTMKEGLPKDTMKGLPKDTMKELPRDTIKEDLPEDDLMKNVTTELAMKDDLSEDTIETYLSEDTMEEDLSEDSKKEDLSEDNHIKSDEVPGLIAFSLAVCAELILYQYEDNKNYMKHIPDMWIKFFDENLKELCDEAGCTSDHLKAYSESIRCPDNFLNKFVTENKNEYQDIETKFKAYIETNYAVESPDGCKFIIEVRNFPKGVSFAKMKAQFRAIVESCKCAKAMEADEVPLLSDYSPCSTPTSL